ncbi:MAG TPA: type IX secretion system sortase PorU, partial [Bacteroidales bacterium]
MKKSLYITLLLLPQIVFGTDISLSKYSATTENSVLSSGTWYKMKITNDGIYKLTYSQLKKWFSKPSNVKVYGGESKMLSKNANETKINDLQQVALYINKGSDNTFNEGDYILFYGEGPDKWSFDSTRNIFRHTKHQFSDYNYYFITDNEGAQNIIQEANNGSNSSNNISITTFDDYSFIEHNDVNLINSGAEWYGDLISNGSKKTFSFNFTNIVSLSKAYVYYDLVSNASTEATFTLKYGNDTKTFVVTAPFSSETVGNKKTGGYYIDITNSAINISVGYTNSASSEGRGFINYLGINVIRELTFDGSQLKFRTKESANNPVLKYFIKNGTSNTLVWDVTDAKKPKTISTNLTDNNIVFSDSGNKIKQYIAFDNSSGFLTPEVIEKPIANQNIHGANTPDMIIVIPQDSAFYLQANRLAAFRKQNDNINCMVVDVQQVYNEFSSGKKDVTAIRDMVKMFYDRGNADGNHLKYLLLFGKGTFANHIEKENNFNLIPVYQSQESLNKGGSYATDDYYGWMNTQSSESANLLQIGIGRLPAKNGKEAKALIDKIIAYDNPSNISDWQNTISFIADDIDESWEHSFEANSDKYAQYIETMFSRFTIQKIYLDAFKQITTSIGESYPEAKLMFNNRINNGALVVNYVGHGNEKQLAGENIIDISSIRSWNNKSKLPLFITATCEFSRFDDVNLAESKQITSAGEEIILNQYGGGIALMTTTRQVYNDDNNILNDAILKNLFLKDENGNKLRIGDVFMKAKNRASSTGLNRLNFTLLGDPSLALKYPEERIIAIDSVNGKNNFTDTINALDLVNIKGHLEPQEGFSGNLYITIFDKEDSIETLLNDEASLPFQYATWQKIIFRGEASIANDSFSFTFPVPKDIKYQVGKGRMVFFATDGKQYFSYDNKNIIVGGINNNVAKNYDGPTIQLFMNDTNFVSGGITDSQPALLAHIKDENGINSTGNGIGHDITAVLDGDLLNTFVLNDYYRNSIDSYQEGTVYYPLSGIEIGKHQIKLMVWDIFNNYSEAGIDFEVVSSESPTLKRIYNYPNPMRNSTSFVLEHNWPDKDLKVEIMIYSMTGERVASLKYQGSFAGYKTAPINWDGTNQNGTKVFPGIYIYKAVITDTDNQQSSNFGKLVI